MAEIRQGYLDDYSQNNTGVGIGTSSPTEAKLEIVGGTTAQELNVTGISTLTHVSGFIKKHTDYTENVNITAGDSGTLSGEIVVGAGLTITVGTAVTATATSSQGTIESLKVYNMFQPPSGTTNQRPPAKPGALFYNFDFKTIEFFDGNSWRQVDNTTRSGRGLVSSGDGGSPTANQVSIDLININTLGNAVLFGDISEARTNANGCSNGTRGVFAGGYQAPTTEMDTIDYVTIAAEGNAIDFGNLSIAKNSAGSASSSTRGLWMGGTLAPTNGAGNTIDYIEIATLGDALDFGDLSTTRTFFHALSSSTRAITAGGNNPAMTALLEFVIIASKGNAVKFGELTQARRGTATATSFVRGIISNGSTPTYINTIDYITMASEGNAIDFGNSTQKRENRTGVTNTIRGVFTGGLNPGLSSTRINTIDFVIITTGGNAADFGDLTVSRRASGGASDSHGGLGGF